ncbi:MAG: alkaline phosphatase family protein [Akkermansia sp.]
MTRPSNRIAVLDIVGLSRGVLSRMPRLTQWSASRRISSFIPTCPAVTCTAQSTFLTGLTPEKHGITGNGWYNRSLNEVQFWKQSEALIHGSLLWETLQQQFGKDFTCAKLFWWYNMYSTANWTITPRPSYPADGRKVFDIYTHPMGMKDELKADLGAFPFPYFWGPMAGLPSSQWIAQSARWIEEKYSPTLSLVYLPHLDYDLQRYGTNDQRASPAIQQIDDLVCDLIDFYEKRAVEIIILSEYGISPVTHSISINRIFRQRGWISIKPELGTETLDCGDSDAFAIADHQVAQIYINNPELIEQVRACLLSTPGIAEVRTIERESTSPPLQERMPDLVAIAQDDAWFDYYFWTDDAVAPDYARCVDIHRKPGYDPAELFIDPNIHFPLVKTAGFLLKKKLGFRALLKLIPLDGDMIRGSHGRDIVSEKDRPIFISSPKLPPVQHATDVYPALLGAFRNE